MTTVNQHFKSFNQHRAVEAALNNELKTRERVERLERHVVDAEKRAESVREEFHCLSRRDFVGRCKWLFLGR